MRKQISRLLHAVYIHKKTFAHQNQTGMSKLNCYTLLILLCSFLLLTSLPAKADDNYGAVKGFITTSDGKPAPYVTVQLINKGKPVLTDDKGNFEITNIASGTYTITATLVVHQSLKQSITIES